MRNNKSIVFNWFTNDTGKRGLSPDPSYPGNMVQSDLDDKETPDRDELIQQKFDREFDKD